MSAGWARLGADAPPAIGLVRAVSRGREEIGELVLYGDEQVLWRRLRSQLATIVVAQLLQSLMLAGLIMLMFNRMVTVHVRRIASHLEGVRPGNLGAPASGARQPEPGRIGAVGLRGVNQLQSSLANHLERQQRYEHELAEHRDRLAHLVDERTAELQAANARLQSLARTDPLTGLPTGGILTRSDHRNAPRPARAAKSGPADLRYRLLQGLQRPLRAPHGRPVPGHRGPQRPCRCSWAGLETGRADRWRRVWRAAACDRPLRRPTRWPSACALRWRPAPSNTLYSQAAQVVTISIGLAVLEPGAKEEFEALFQEADQALYRAKAAGRNQVAARTPASPSVKGETA